MNQKTIVAITRLVVGGAIFITSMITGVDGAAQMLSMFLMGVPIEYLQKDED